MIISLFCLKIELALSVDFLMMGHWNQNFNSKELERTFVRAKNRIWSATGFQKTFVARVARDCFEVEGLNSSSQEKQLVNV